MRSMGIAGAALALAAAVILAGCGGSDGDDRDFGQIVFDSTAGSTTSVSVMNGFGGGQREVVANGEEPALSPNGRTVAFIRGADIYSINTDGTGLTNLTNNQVGMVYGDLVFSPDGSQFAFTVTPVSPTPVSAVFTMDADGSNQATVTSDGDDPSFSPDGSEILFVRGTSLFTVDMDGTDETLIRDFGSGVTISGPVYNLGGTRIAFVRQSTAPGSVAELNLLNPTDGLWTKITDGGTEPSFSPDGTRIAFVRSGAIWSVNLSGTSETQLTTGPADSRPDWGPSAQ